MREGNPIIQPVLYHEIDDVFSTYESFVIAIKGEWGSGKTFFWNQFVENKLDDVKYAYVSLFGKESIEDIKRDVIFQISLKDKHLSTVKEKVSSIKSTFGFKEDDQSFGMSGAVLGSVMSLFEKKDFENVVVCIDDFERRSKNLDIKEILGYVSVLKEKYNCKVVLILNEEKISDEDDVYMDYKEKIIDFEYIFSPSVEECYKSVESELTNYNQIFLNYCKLIGFNNIRIMKRVIRLLNKINKVLGNTQNYKDSTVETFINEVLLFSIVNYKYGFIEFDKFEIYLKSKRMHSFNDLGKEFSLNLKYEKIMVDMNISSSFYIDTIDRVIINYLKTSILDIDTIKEELDKLDTNYQDAEIKNEFYNMEEKFLYDLGTTPSEYVNKVYSFFEKHGYKIIKATSFDNYMFYYKQLLELDSEHQEKYVALLKSTGKDFIDYVMELDDVEFLRHKEIRTNQHILEVFKEQIPSLKEYIEQKLSERRESSYNCEILLAILKKLNEKSGWHVRDEEYLNNISKEFLLQCLQKTDILQETATFLRNGARSPSFNAAKDTILQTFNEIELTNVNGNGFKIKRLKYLAGINSDIVENKNEESEQ